MGNGLSVGEFIKNEIQVNQNVDDHDADANGGNGKSKYVFLFLLSESQDFNFAVRRVITAQYPNICEPIPR